MLNRHLVPPLEVVFRFCDELVYYIDGHLYFQITAFVTTADSCSYLMGKLNLLNAIA